MMKFSIVRFGRFVPLKVPIFFYQINVQPLGAAINKLPPEDQVLLDYYLEHVIKILHKRFIIRIFTLIFLFIILSLIIIFYGGKIL